MKTTQLLAILFFSITVAVCGGDGSAAPAVPPVAALGTLNDTGQTLCYDNAVAITCANTGSHPRQDARFGRDTQAVAGTLTKTGASTGVGINATGFDYTKVCMNGSLNCTAAVNQTATPTATDWACTKDNHTGLTWSLETHPIDTWANATTLPAAANTANRCGFNTGWRLPTRRELLSIAHSGTSNPSIDTAYFPGTAPNFYWSNDILAPYPASAWSVAFGGGSSDANHKTAVSQVRLVRGTPLPAAALTDNGNGTVTDTVTGLMWEQCSQGQSDAACATGTATLMTWSAALTAAVTANTASYKGYSDWCLPNKNELESLADITDATNPVIDLTAFPATPASSIYWSSTTYTRNPAYAWDVNFYDGGTVAYGKTNNNRVRLVRSGQ